MTDLNVVICIDDVHPQRGWMIRGDKTEGYLNSLNMEFGAKFSLFIPSYYHSLTAISLDRDWVHWLVHKNFFEICAHGHYHDCKNKMLGEQEFLELDYTDAKERVDLILNEWDKVGVRPKGFRMPGWGCSQGSAEAVGESFDFVAAHADINFNISFPTKTFYGCDGIHEDSKLNIQAGNLVIFQSHICGDWNKNTWTDSTFENFRRTLDYLRNEYKVNFTTFDKLL